MSSNMRPDVSQHCRQRYMARGGLSSYLRCSLYRPLSDAIAVTLIGLHARHERPDDRSAPIRFAPRSVSPRSGAHNIASVVNSYRIWYDLKPSLSVSFECSMGPVVFILQLEDARRSASRRVHQ